MVLLAAGRGGVALQRAAVPDVCVVVLKDVAAANAEGAAYPAGDPNTAQPGWAGAPSGDASRKCVDVADSDAVRSGDFIAGPFSFFRTSWQEGRTKVWWVPRFLNDTTPRDLGERGLLIRSTRLDAPGHHVFRFGGIVRNSVGFFNSTAWLPTAGRWMMVTTFESNWGCFVVDLH
jgi:hypothetical protein